MDIEKNEKSFAKNIFCKRKSCNFAARNREIEEKTGLEFVYISKGTDNRQEQMARNSQADIISVHGKNLAVYGVSEYYLLNYNGTSIYIGFTKIMDEDTVKLIRNCLDYLPQSVSEIFFKVSSVSNMSLSELMRHLTTMTINKKINCIDGMNYSL